MNLEQMFIKNTFNLFPKNIERHRNIKKLIYLVITLLLLMNICISAYTFVLYQRIHAVNQTKHNNELKIEALAPLKELNISVRSQKANLDKLINFDKSLASVDAPMFEIFKKMESITPKGILLSTVNLTGDGKITMTGLAKDELVACNFVSALKGLDMLSDVTLKSVAKQEDNKKKSGKYVSQFNIECQVKSMIKTEEKDAKQDAKQDTKQQTKKGS